MMIPGNPTGVSPMHNWLRKLRAAVESSQVTSVIGGRVNRGPNGTQIIIDAFTGGGAGSAVKRFVIISVQGDYLTCKEAAADGTAGTGADVLVAKPKPLRSSEFGSAFPSASVHVTTRTSTPLPAASGGFSAGATYSETLIPDYVAGDNDIYAAQKATGVTGCDWIDLNASARKYLPIKTEVKVCVLVNGVQTPRKIIVSGGPIY